MDRFDVFSRELQSLKDRGLYRGLRSTDSIQGPRVEMDGREVIVLCSNNYLGLSSHPYVMEKAKEAMDRYGSGAGASRLVSGTMKIHMELEERIADFKGREAAILFNSGYHANIGVITSLVGRGDTILSDRLNHASIIDGAILSRANLIRYPHMDIGFLENLLKRHSNNKGKRTLVITEGIFSMDGDIAPLKEIVELSKRYGALLLIDDAHGTGVLGERGRGTLEHLGIRDDSIIEMGTFGKALGSFGAFVAGRREVIDIIRNRARSFIYTTALPPSVCGASIAALELVDREPERRERLLKMAGELRDGLRRSGFDTLKSNAHIIPLLIGENTPALEMSSRLLKEGIFIQAIRPPTVPDGTSRLRITPMSEHRTDELRYALEAIRGIGRELEVID